MKYSLQAEQFNRDSDKAYQAKSKFPSWITAFAEISSSFPPALVIYNDKFDSKLLHLSKTQDKKEMKLYEWLIDALSMELWKESAVFGVCTFCLFTSFNKLRISDFCQLLTAKTICLFFCLYGESDNNLIRLIYNIRKQEEDEGGINQIMTNRSQRNCELLEFSFLVNRIHLEVN